MNHSEMKKTMLETILRRSLLEIERDPKRGVRTLVDLGMETSGGRLQQHFLGLAQDMLKKEDSPYYTLVQNVLHFTDSQRLLTFGIDLGWNSLTQGVGRIRELEAREGYNIPWALTLHMERQAGGLNSGDCLRLVLSGMELGIYSYFLFPEDRASVHMALNLAAASRECAFCLFLPRGFRLKENLEELPFPANVILGVDGCEPGWEERVELLRERKMLYLIYRRYSSQADVEEILSDTWTRRVMPYAGLSIVLISSAHSPLRSGCPKYPVYQYALDTRMGQRYPTLIFDFYSDLLYADVLISDDPCFVGVLPDGTVTEFRDREERPTELSIRTAPLAPLLRHFPKARKRA